MPRHLYFALLAIAGLNAPASAAPADLFEVRADHASCLIANRVRYLSAKDDILFIYAALCPELTPSRRQIEAMARNAGPDENPESRTLVIERRYLPCFFHRLAAARQRVRTRSAILRVSIAGCR